MQRSFSDPVLSSRHAVRSIATQTDTPVPRTRSRQTRTEPRLCLDCHTAHLVELLRAGRPGLIPANPGGSADHALFTIVEDENEKLFEPMAPAFAFAAAGAEKPTPAELLAHSLRDPGGFPLRHALHDPELLRLVLDAAPQSLAERTAE